jgi:hypothetical protein
MKLKPGVMVAGVQPEIMLGIMAAHTVYEGLGVELVITSVLDGKHSSRSLHYKGQAIDIRTREMTHNTAKRACELIKKALPDDFDVVLEKDHIHLEYDVKPRKT